MPAAAKVFVPDFSELHRRHGRNGQLSPLMKFKAENRQETPYVCPFGCKAEESEARGICRHYVGVTVPGDQTKYEPYSVRKLGGKGVEHLQFDGVDGTKVQQVRPTDQLVQITCSYRVYRENPDDPTPTATPTPVKTGKAG